MKICCWFCLPVWKRQWQPLFHIICPQLTVALDKIYEITAIWNTNRCWKARINWLAPSPRPDSTDINQRWWVIKILWTIWSEFVEGYKYWLFDINSWLLTGAAPLNDSGRVFWMLMAGRMGKDAMPEWEGRRGSLPYCCADPFPCVRGDIQDVGIRSLFQKPRSLVY